MIVNLDDQAGIAAGLGLFAAAVWKIYLRLKKDTREDSSDKRKTQAESNQFDHYDNLIKNLREEVDRLAKSVGLLSVELEKERRARYEAEQISSDLKRKVIFLEFEVNHLKGGLSDRPTA